VIGDTHYHNINANIKNQDYWLLTSNVGIKIQEALNCSTGLKNTGLFSHILGTSSLHGYLLTEGHQLTCIKLFYKHVRNHDQVRGKTEISKNTE